MIVTKCCPLMHYIVKLEMWASAQCDGHPAEYRWRPLFNAAKLGWRPLIECSAVTLPRREICWNLQGCPKLTKRSQSLVGRSSPYYGDMWRRYCCLTCFFQIVDKCLSCEDIKKGKGFPILDTERWARSWSRCTGSQPAGDRKSSTRR